jgi:hypothetical protein
MATLTHRKSACPSGTYSNDQNTPEQHQFRNVDFAATLNMNASSVNEHIEKLKDAELIGIDYFQHHYLISLNPKKLHTLFYFILENE